jgi:hypothetical protein
MILGFLADFRFFGQFFGLVAFLESSTEFWVFWPILAFVVDFFGFSADFWVYNQF